MSDRKERCDNCKYWRCDVPDVGSCHRLPPTTTLGAVVAAFSSSKHAQQGFWPITDDEEWCGEWKAKEGAEVTEVVKDKLPEPFETMGLGSPEFGISSRSVKILFREGIYTVGELVRVSSTELRDMRHFGAASLTEVRAALAKHGLKLKGE